MPSVNIDVTRYNGSLLTPELLSEDTTLVLSDFGPPSSGTLKDNEGTLEVSDNEKSTFNNSPIQYLGAGTIQPGVEVAGIVVPVGSPVRIVVFNAAGQTYFYYPDGPPNALTAVVAVLDVDPVPFEVFENPYVGTAEADNIVGDDLDNILVGRAGDDTLDGGAGADQLFGGAGDDVFIVDSEGDVVIEQPDGGFDRVEASVSFDLGAGVEDLVLTGTDGVDGAGNALANGITGNAGNNSLRGGAGDDRIRGGAGDDRLEGGTGSDLLFGGAGDDRLFGGSEDDRLLGGQGNDRLNGGTGNDLLKGGAGDDRLLGGDGDDRLLGGAGDDLVEGDAGDDRLSSGTGADRLFGGLGNDRLDGGADADAFYFDAGSDTIRDFEDDVDTIVFDDALWGGGPKTFAEILSFATVSGGDAVFDFGDGNVVVVKNVSDLDTLANDVEWF